MTVSSNYLAPQYTADGVTKAFGFPFQFFNTSDLSVTIYNPTTAVTLTPTLNGATTYDYSLSVTTDTTGTGEYLYATLTFNTAPPAGDTITITRTVPATQPSTYTDYGPFPAKSVEAAFDRLTILIQQLSALQQRSLQAPSSDSNAISLTLPPMPSRALMLLGFDSSGNVIGAQPTSALVSSAMTAIVAAVSASSALSLLGGASVSALVANVATVAALRGSTTASLPQSIVYLAGYAANNDGGGGIFTYAVGDASNDDSGTIIVDASGRRWFRQYDNNTISLLWFGGNTAADFAPVFNRALIFITGLTSKRPGAALILPPLRMVLNSPVTWNFPANTNFHLVMRGAGPGATTLHFPASNGFTFNFSLAQHNITLADFEITTADTTGTYNGITLTQSQPQLWFAQNLISNVTARGSDQTGLSNYWKYGILVTGLGNINFQSYLYWGHPGTGYTASGYGVSVSGNSASAGQFGIVYNFTDCSFWEMGVGIFYGNGVQGMTVKGCNFTNGVTGIQQPVSTSGGCQLTVSESQFNCFGNGIVLGGAGGNLMAMNNFFLIGYSGASGIGLAPGANWISTTIKGNQFDLFNSPTSTNGIYLVGTGTIGIISGNIFYGITNAVALGPNMSTFNVQSNTYSGCTNNVTNSGTGNTIGGGSS